MFQWIRNAWENLKARFAHPIFYVLFLVLCCWGGITSFFHHGKTWQESTTFVLGGINQLLIAVIMALKIAHWFVDRKRSEEKTTASSTDH
jgi:cytochrome b561